MFSGNSWWLVWREREGCRRERRRGRGGEGRGIMPLRGGERKREAERRPASSTGRMEEEGEKEEADQLV